MRGLTRATAYLPSFADGLRRRAAPDEDAFTMVATAIERALDRSVADARPQTVHLVGDAGALDPSLLASLLGSPAEIVPAASGAFADAVRAAASAEGAAWVAVVQRADERSDASPAPGDGAVALRFDDGPEAIPLAESGLLRAGTTGASPLAALFELGRAPPRPGVWVGDWASDPTRARPVPRSPRRGLGPAPANVSEGALVPGPRDEEARAARWRFLADRCGACGVVTFPPRGRCRGCGHDDRLAPTPLPLDGGEVVASTWIGPGGQPTEFDPVVEVSGSYGVVLVDVGSGVRVTLSVADAAPEEVRVGARVNTRLRRLYPMEGRWRYGRKAVPADGSGGPR